MKPAHIILLTGCLTIFILDALAAIASRRFNFNYARLAPLSFIIYTIIGYVGTLVVNQDTGVLITTAIGFFDATVGWKTSMLFKANTGKFDNNPSVSRWISTAIFVTILAAICGIAGSELLKLSR